jgi:rod shape-determining protein MreB
LRAEGLVLNEPSVVAIDGSSRVLAAGWDAVVRSRQMPDDVRLRRPLRGGVIADRLLAAAMVHRFFDRVGEQWPIGQPAVVVCVPSDITAEQRCAFQDVVEAAGARAGFVIEDPVAAAIGAGLPIADEAPSMLVDAGAGTTDVAVLASGGIIVSRSVPLGGNDLNAAIAAHLLLRHGLRVRQRAAERIKLRLGELLAGPDGRDAVLEVHGRDRELGEPTVAHVGVGEVQAAIEPVVADMVSVVRETLDAAPERVAAALVDGVISLTGGTALLPGLDVAITAATGLDVRVSDDPMYRVAAGARTCLRTAGDLAVFFAGTR